MKGRKVFKEMNGYKMEERERRGRKREHRNERRGKNMKGRREWEVRKGKKG